MFERYTESARRALFYARYEASELGARVIDTEHLLLGVVRESRGVTADLLTHVGVSPERIRAELASPSPAGQKVPTSAELPFTAAARRVLEFAASESDGLQHSYVGTEHLLLGLLREPDGRAAAVLGHPALDIEAARRRLVQLLGESHGAPRRTEILHTRDRIDALKSLVRQLADTLPGTAEARELAQRILDGLDAFEGDR